MPNPAREQVWIQGVHATDAVRVLDASGREVAVSQWRQGAVIQLELNGLSSGMYHVAVTAPNGATTTARLAVQ